MSKGRIDYDFRPERYFWPLSAEKQILTRVKGSLRRDAVKAMIEIAGVRSIPEGVADEELQEEERIAVGMIHPWFMGGEYLPSLGRLELEIGRITIKSTTRDVVSMYARKGKSRIHYRVVDEYEGETLNEKHTRTSIRPLKFRDFLDFFLEAWSFMDVLSLNFDEDLEGMLKFFGADSEFYPDFHDALEDKVIDKFGKGNDQDIQE